MKAKYSIFLMFLVMMFSLFLVGQDTKAPATTDSKAACAGCDHSSADMKSCCKDGKGCEMKDGKMACKKDCCAGMKDVAKGKSCCKDGKCEMAKGDKKCCGDSCKMKNKAS